jgi:hypothetical protein
MRTMTGNDGTTTVRRTEDGVSVHWGGVFAGLVIGLGSLVLLSSFWIALGFGSDQGWVADNMGWWLGGMLLVALAIAGYVAGRSAWNAASASVNAVVVWGFTMIALTVAGGTTLFSSVNLKPILARPGGTNAAGPWLTFVAIALGLLFALGGAGAGAGSRRSGSAETGSEVRIPEETATTTATARTTGYPQSAAR